MARFSIFPNVDEFRCPSVFPPAQSRVMTMKVIEQLSWYLRNQGVLSDEDFVWLRAEGFLGDIEPEWDDEAEPFDPYEFEREHVLSPLEETEEQLMLEALAERAKLPPLSSKGSRRARRRRTNARSVGKQARHSARIKSEKRAIGHLKSDRVRSAVPPLVQALSDSREVVRLTAAGLLERLQAAEAIPALTLTLEDTAPRVRVAAAAALAMIDGTEATSAVEFLKNTAESADVDSRIDALYALGRIGPPLAEPAIQVLVDALEYDTGDSWNSRDIRSAASRALRSFRPSLHWPILDALSELRDPWSGEHFKAFAARPTVAADLSVPFLTRALGSEKIGIRKSAVTALGLVGSPAADPAIPELLRLLQNEVSYEVQFEVKSVIESFGASAVPGLIDVISETCAQGAQVRVSALALDALKNIGPPATNMARSIFVERLNDSGLTTRVKAARALGECVSADISLRVLIDVEATAVRWVGVKASLDRFGSAALNVLADLACDAEDVVRRNTLEVVEMFETPLSLRLLIALRCRLSAADATTRGHAAEAVRIIERSGRGSIPTS